MAEELNKLRGYLRHDGLCGLIGGYGSCTCGLEQAEADAIAAWNARPTPPTVEMKPWLGGDSAPDDWDGRGAIGRHGAWIASDGIHRWTHEGNGADIVAYTARRAPPTEAQVEAVVCVLLTHFDYDERHPEPYDALLRRVDKAAREILALEAARRA